MTLLCDPLSFRAFLKTKPRIFLGSSSSSRRAILDELCKEYDFKYEVVKAGIDEQSFRSEDPTELVTTLGYQKAKAILNRNKASWNDIETYLITSDQVVVHSNRILEKPKSEDEIRRNAIAFAETPAQTVGSVVCTHWPSQKQRHHVDIATLYMNRLPDPIVDQLIAEGNVFHSAGGLLAEHPSVVPYVTRIDGGLDAIMGLSKSTVIGLLIETWNSIHQDNQREQF